MSQSAGGLSWAKMAIFGVGGIFLVSVLAFIGIFPPVYNGSKASVTCVGGGACPVASSSNGRAALRTYTTPVGFNVTEDGDNIIFREVGFQNDIDRLSLYASTNLMLYSIGDATYRVSYLFSTAGTPLFHAHYQLFIFMRQNDSYTGVVTTVFTAPPEFASPTVDDGGSDINVNGVLPMACSGINNDDGMPLEISAYLLTREVVYIGYPGPTFFIRFNAPTSGGGGMGVLCDVDVIAPLPQ